MILDADDLPSGTPVTADVCIVGGGAAGITVARDLAAAGADVVVLESGGEEYEAATADLYEGTNVGRPLVFGQRDMTLESTRLRMLGGSTNHWSGMCRPLDEHDFAARSHLDWSGWPLEAGGLDRYYRQAHETCELGPFEWSGRTWFEEHFARPPLADAEGIVPVVYQFSPPTRFGERYRGELAVLGSPRVVLHANVVDIGLGADETTVRKLEVRTLAGNAFPVEADRFVLATGGLEVPRLLLASTGAGPAGIGNEHGLVGRHFMDHPHFTPGRIVLSGAKGNFRPYRLNVWDADGANLHVWAGWALSPEIQTTEGIGNAVVFAWADRGDTARGPAGISGSLADHVDRVARGKKSLLATLSVRTEARPDPDSRVVLGEEPDALGVPRIRLDWRLGDFEWDTARRTLELLGQALGATESGRLEVDPGGEDFRKVTHVGIGCHHMGTTRMATDPREGVVDADCKVHGVDNLYVAGSAVFPTSGAANPTLTIVALAHRLADHLAGGS